MRNINFEQYAASLLKWGTQLRKEGRYCPLGCRGNGVVCVGRAGTHQERIIAVDEGGIPNDVLPSAVLYPDDCPVVVDPNSTTIEIRKQS